MNDTPLRNPINDAEALRVLRERAEQRRQLVTQDVASKTPQEVKRLLQELQTHQIELEMQYEELLMAQAEADKARVQYADLYEFAPVGYLTIDAQSTILQMNLHAAQLLGPMRQRLIRRRLALFVDLKDRERFAAFLESALAQEGRQTCELAFRRDDDIVFHGQLVGSRMLNPDGTAYCRVALSDVTERHTAAQALIESETRFRQLFEQSSDPVLLVRDTIILDCNQAVLSMMGARSKDELVGQPLTFRVPEYQPGGGRSAELVQHHYRTVLRQGSHRFEWYRYNMQGMGMWLEIVLTRISLGGENLVHVVWRDITAQHEAREQLRESEARLSMALNASETGIFTLNIQTNELYWDERAQAVFGQAHMPGPVPVAVLANAFHPEDAERVWAATEAAIATQEPLALDYRVVWPDGSIHYASSAGRAIVDAAGRSVGFIGVLRDMTAQHATQEELHYKSLVLRRLLSNMPMILSRYQPDGTVLEAAGKGLKALSMNDNFLVGHNILDFFPRAQAEMQAVLNGEQGSFLAELTVEGQPVALQNYGFFDEQRKQAVVLSIDVTEAEQQKRQLRSEKEFTQRLLESSVDGIVALDHEGRITAWNTQASHYFGRSAAAVLGHTLFEVLPSLDTPTKRQIVGRVLAGEQVMLEGQAFAHRPGQYDAFHVPLREKDDEDVTGILIIFRDVTERNRLLEETTRLKLRQQQELLAAILNTQEAERKRIAEALHNGVGQLLYATKLHLENQAKTSKHRDGAMALLDEAIKMTRMISFELTPGILEDFGLTYALEELLRRIPRQHLEVHLHAEGMEKPLPRLLEVAVYRIVQELFNNIIKHAQAQEAFIYITREDNKLSVSVEDNGQGFDNAHDTKPRGGIGLPGLRNRVSLLGGTLTIASRPGQGTIISIELPIPTEVESQPV